MDDDAPWMARPGMAGAAGTSWMTMPQEYELYF
jgi:hypothetical protein